MKVLLITPNNLLENNGGGINIKKFYLTLKNMKINFEVYSPNKLIESFIVANKNKKYDILSRIKGHSNYMYIDYKINRKKILNNNPDVIIISNSRLGFIAKDISLNLKNTKIITNIDNIEYDYCNNYMDKYNGIKRFLSKSIEKLNVKRDEKMAFRYSNHIIFLTNRDSKRAKQLYHNKIESSIIPVCLEKREFNFKKNNFRLNLVFLSSLWYAPNAEGIIWFIKNVWKNINHIQCSLIIGGKNPPDNLMKYDGSQNINIYPNFRNVEDIVPQNSVFISPIFKGAGMKVKVAEALSMGFPIIASNESLIGYEEVNECMYNKCIYRANTAQEYIRQIDKFIKNFDYVTNNSLIIFEKYYSYERVKNTLIKILGEDI